jgi:hypothetical protein
MKFVTIRLKLTDVFDKTRLNKLKKKYGISRSSEFIRKGMVHSNVEFMADELERIKEKGGLAEEIAKLEKEKRMVITTITSSRIDRDGEIVRPDGMRLDGYNGVVLAGHDYKGLGVGKNIWLKASENKESIIAKTEYATTDKANEYYDWRHGGFPMATSIGFAPTKYVSRGEKEFGAQIKDLVNKGWLKENEVGNVRRIYTEWFLLEYSDVTVPANPDAQEIAVSKGIMPISPEDNGVVKYDEDNEVEPTEIMPASSTITIEDEPHDEEGIDIEDSENELDEIDDSEEEKSMEEKAEVEEADGEYAVRLKDSKLFEQDSFRRITVKKNKPRIFATIGKLKGETKTTLQSYKFPKEDGWTKKTAGEWADKHPVKSIEESKTTIASEDEMIPAVIETKAVDEDGNPSINDILHGIFFALNNNDHVNDTYSYVRDIYPSSYPHGHAVIDMMIEGSDISERQIKTIDWEYLYDHTKKRATLFNAREVELQWTGVSEEPVNLAYVKMFKEEKAGRVLSAKNRGSVTKAIDALNEVLKADDKEDSKREEKPKTITITENKKEKPATVKIGREEIATLVAEMQKTQLEKTTKELSEIKEEINNQFNLAMGKAVYDK